ncbi:MAG: uroporphyrinogen-III synthase [Ginsengibacter sp.]
MQNGRINILSTKILGNTLNSIAIGQGISFDEKSFIEIENIISPDLTKRIMELAGENVTVIFTSPRAVDAVGKELSEKPSWRIFCIGYKTREQAEIYFGKENIIGIADHASQLAEEIIQHSSVKKMIFFCGNQRRDTLPERLKTNGIKLEELIVYNTVEKPQVISKLYDGILFFSPSGVKSFFSVNTLTNNSQLFAIGATTAEAINVFTKFPVIISPHPHIEEMVRMAIHHLLLQKSPQ